MCVCVWVCVGVCGGVGGALTRAEVGTGRGGGWEAFKTASRALIGRRRRRPRTPGSSIGFAGGTRGRLTRLVPPAPPRASSAEGATPTPPGRAHPSSAPETPQLLPGSRTPPPTAAPAFPAGVARPLCGEAAAVSAA